MKALYISSTYLLLLVAQVLPGQSIQIDEQLQRISSTYNSIQNYVVVINHRRKGGATPVPDAHIADGDEGETVLPFDPLSSPESVIVLARSGRAFHYQIGAPGNKNPMLWITNGDITWHYRPWLKEYTEIPAGEWPKEAGPAAGLPGIEWKYFAKFRAIAGMTNRAKLLKDDVAPNDTCPSASSVLELQLGTGAVEELHVLTKSNLVCQSIVRRRMSFGGHVEYFVDTTSWKFLATSEPIDPGLFIFRPSKGTRKVQHFK